MDDVTEDKDVRIIFLIHSAYDMHVVKHNVSLCNALRVFPISSNIFLYAPGALIAAFPRIYKDNTYDIQYFYNAYGVPNIPRYTLDARLYPYITTYVKEYEHSRVRILLSLIHISEPTRLLSISYAVFCLKKKKKKKNKKN